MITKLEDDQSTQAKIENKILENELVKTNLELIYHCLNYDFLGIKHQYEYDEFIDDIVITIPSKY